jgi:hypothetical protein
MRFYVHIPSSVNGFLRAAYLPSGYTAAFVGLLPAAIRPTACAFSRQRRFHTAHIPHAMTRIFQNHNVRFHCRAYKTMTSSIGVYLELKQNCL